MKTNKIIAAALAIAVAASCAPKGDVAVEGAKDFLPKKAQVDSVSYLVGINFGSFLKGYDFGELNYNEMIKGMEDFLKAEGMPNDPAFVEQFKINPNEMNTFINKYLGLRHDYTLAVNEAKEAAFLEENGRQEGVQTTESGLQYRIIEPGSDVRATAQDTVRVTYKGTLLDGTVFDETPEGADPIEFPLDRVIPGWTEGMQLIGEGGKITLYVPSALGYGERGNQGIAPNSTLIFEVELVEVKPSVEK